MTPLNQEVGHTGAPWAAIGGWQIDSLKRKDKSRDDMMDFRSLVFCEAPYNGNEFDDGDTNEQSVATAYGRTGEEAVANALLIAAAPELLEVCKYALVSHPKDEATKKMLIAAISKASGGQS